MSAPHTTLPIIVASLKRIIILSSIGFIVACNVTAPNRLDFYRTTLPEQTTRSLYASLPRVSYTDSSLCDNQNLTSSNTAPTSYYFFYRHRDRISYLNDTLSTDTLKPYDVCFSLWIHPDTLETPDPNQPNILTFTNENFPALAPAQLTFSLYEFATGTLLNTGFTGNLELNITNALPGNTVETGNITLQLIHEANEIEYQFSGTFTPP